MDTVDAWLNKGELSFVPFWMCPSLVMLSTGKFEISFWIFQENYFLMSLLSCNSFYGGMIICLFFSSLFFLVFLLQKMSWFGWQWQVENFMLSLWQKLVNNEHLQYIIVAMAYHYFKLIFQSIYWWSLEHHGHYLVSILSRLLFCLMFSWWHYCRCIVFFSVCCFIVVDRSMISCWGVCWFTWR